MKSFKEILSEKIEKLDPRYGTSKDPRLDITSDAAYKKSGSGTGIWRAGIGHNPDIFQVDPKKEIMSAEEREKADAANRQRELAKREKGRSREELQNRFDPFTAYRTRDEVANEIGIPTKTMDNILKKALEKVRIALGKDFRPSDYTPRIKDPM